MHSIRTLPPTARFATLSGLGAAPEAQYDSQGFEIWPRAGTKSRPSPDDAGAPTANPFWNVSGIIRLACADFMPSERITEVLRGLEKQGYEVGPFRLSERLARRVRAGSDGGLNLPFVCAFGKNTNAHEILIRVYKKGGSPEQGKRDVQAALARLGWDLGDTGNFVVESFRANVTDHVERAIASASQAVATQTEKVAVGFCGQQGRDCQTLTRNVVILLGGLGAAYLLTTFVAPIVSAARK